MTDFEKLEGAPGTATARMTHPRTANRLGMIPQARLVAFVEGKGKREVERATDEALAAEASGVMAIPITTSNIKGVRIALGWPRIDKVVDAEQRFDALVARVRVLGDVVRSMLGSNPDADKLSNALDATFDDEAR